MTTLCARCGEPVLHTTSGRLLTPQPHRLGLYHPEDGEILGQHDIATRIRQTGLAGHTQHRCPQGQTELFNAQEVHTA